MNESATEQLIQEADPFKLELKDEEFVDVIDQRAADSRAYYSKKNLRPRQKKLREYYKGVQGDATIEKNLPKYATPYLENIVYGGMSRQKPIALSRLPDMVVKAGDGGEVSRDSAETLTDLMNTDIKSRKRREILGRAFKEEPLNFYAVIKCRWNEELGFDGDYEFINIHPDNVEWDHTCKTSDVDDMSFFSEEEELTAKEVTMMFPAKADEFLEEVGLEDPDKRTEKLMASKYGIKEVHFHWYKDSTDEATGEKQWEKIHAVVWKYNKVVLHKMRNPYFDYEGKINYFTKAKKEKREPTTDEIYEAMFGQGEGQKFYNNYFKNPRKPYYFMTYENMGEDPVDVTTRIEQILLFQDHINLEGLQISEMNARTVGKPVINAQYITKKDAKGIDWKDHNQALTVNADDVRKAFAHIPGLPAPAQMYKSKDTNRNFAYEMIGVNATTRGLRETDSTLGQDQMAREADYGMIDDVVEETINPLSEWMGEWSMQMIKMFYTKAHYKDVVGKDGDSLYTAITQDLVEDGMVVEIGASGVDRIQRKRMAIQNVGMSPDFLNYFQDTEQSNPKERARMAWLSVNAPQLYYQEYLVEEVQPPVTMGETGSPQPQETQMMGVGPQSPVLQGGIVGGQPPIGGSPDQPPAPSPV
ncbi:MAG: hypothetical protein GY861_03140 [bacterium]|nr:hypothetical protein [bacterium]